MDSVTHIALGAVMGEAYAGKELGKKAMLYGALLQSLPDVDVVASLWLDFTDNMLAHRGITHSLIFAVIMAVLLGFVCFRLHRKGELPLEKWIIFFAIEIFAHLFLDVCNGYGTGLFEPFSHERLSFNLLFVADPFFTVWVLIAAIFLMVLQSSNRRRKYFTIFSLVLCGAYILHAIANKYIVSNVVASNAEARNISHNRHFITPTPLNTWLWYVVIEQDSGYMIGYRSVFDRGDSIDLNYYQKQASLLAPVKDTHDVQQLMRFSQHYYTVEQLGDTLIFNDLRFGQIMGWLDPNAKFVFRYYLSQPSDNLIIQRGRFARWDSEAVKNLIQRIGGQKMTTQKTD